MKWCKVWCNAIVCVLALASLTALGGFDQPPKPPAMTAEQKDALKKTLGIGDDRDIDLVIDNRVEQGGKTKNTKKATSIGASGEVVGDKLVLNIDGKPVEISLKDFGLVKTEGFGSSSTAEVFGIPWVCIMFGLASIACFCVASFRLYNDLKTYVPGVSPSVPWRNAVLPGALAVLFAGCAFLGVKFLLIAMGLGLIALLAVVLAHSSATSRVDKTQKALADEKTKTAEAEEAGKSLVKMVDALKLDPQRGQTVKDALAAAKDKIEGLILTPKAKEIVEATKVG